MSAADLDATTLSIQGKVLHIAVAMTCFNRRTKTLECLRRLFASEGPGFRIGVHLVDDGCTDGTGEAVREAHPQANVIRGTGNLFWNGGMHLAMRHAMQAGADAVLWLNDDTMLEPDALLRMVAVWDQELRRTGNPVVVVGSTQDQLTSKLSYGGLVRKSAIQPLRFDLVEPHGQDPVPCHTMNGNCVLLPGQVVSEVGNLEPGYLHSMGDLDYGLRCASAGFRLMVLPGYVGFCTNDAAERATSAKPASLLSYWKDVTGFRKCPPRAWWLFCTRHGGVVGPLVYVKPYLGALARGLLTGRL